MADLVEAFHRTLEAHSFLKLIVLIIPLSAILASGIVIGWVWRPKWGNLENKNSSYSCSSSPRSPHSKSTNSPLKVFGSSPCLSSLNLQSLKEGNEKKLRARRPTIYEDCRNAEFDEKPTTVLTEDDLVELCQLVEMKDGGLPWIHILDRYTSTMTYQAWRRDTRSGPPQYRTRTVFEDTTIAMLRDFFWDDEFRSKWDDMLISSTIIEECSWTGNMVVRWIRKFPFFCNDREYVIGRRIWESGRSYYCVTKAVSSSIPRREKPKRVEMYYSSWYIREVESRRNEGQLSACEVLLFHQEDIGIPYEVAKLGVKQGMWGVVKKIEPGLRAYQKMRSLNKPLSRNAIMAQINTKIKPEITPESQGRGTTSVSEKSTGKKIPRALLIGGFIAVALSLDRGLLSKAILFSMVRKFTNIGKKRNK